MGPGPGPGGRSGCGRHRLLDRVRLGEDARRLGVVDLDVVYGGRTPRAPPGRSRAPAGSRARRHLPSRSWESLLRDGRWRRARLPAGARERPGGARGVRPPCHNVKVYDAKPSSIFTKPDTVRGGRWPHPERPPRPGRGPSIVAAHGDPTADGGEQATGGGAALAVENPATETSPGPCRRAGGRGRGHRRGLRGGARVGLDPGGARASGPPARGGHSDAGARTRAR